MVGGGLMRPGWPSQSLEGTGIGPACGALWLNSAAWELKPMQVPKVPFGIFLVCKVPARQPGTSLETGTCRNPVVGSVRSAHCPGLSGPVRLSRCSAPRSLKPHPPPEATTHRGYYPWVTPLSKLASLVGSTAPLASSHFCP